MDALRPALFALLLLATACGGQDPGSTCPNDLPSACPATAPGYASVAPILSASCTTCHSATGSIPEKALTTYGQVFALRSSILDQVYGCRMPKAGAPPLAEPGRLLLLTWLVCGAPQ
jgi:hypothetical protein